MHRPALSFRDWALVLIILGVLNSLILVNILFKPNQSPNSTEVIQLKNPEYIKIEIYGAVNKPGIYTLEKGTLLKTLLDLSEPLPQANLKAINLEKKLRKKQVILIPEVGKISFFVEGAVQNPGIIMMPQGSKISELKDYVQFTNQADLSFLKKRRKIKQGEKIIIAEHSQSNSLYDH